MFLVCMGVWSRANTKCLNLSLSTTEMLYKFILAPEPGTQSVHRIGGNLQVVSIECDCPEGAFVCV